jgi:hypothetical protein
MNTNNPTDYKYVMLSNNKLDIEIVLPDEARGYYHGSRFDWSGMISKIQFQNHQFIEPWIVPHDPTDPEHGIGTAEEFCEPLGYEQAKSGQTFVKVGVGILEKMDNKNYWFNTAYKIIKPGRWKVAKTDAQIIFGQTLESDLGFAYRYTKKISLDKTGPNFSIFHTLENIGQRDIVVTHYCHNFSKIDKTAVGRDYVIKFPFEVTNLDHELFEPVAQTKGEKIVFLKNIEQGKCVFSNLTGYDDNVCSNQFTIENTKSGAGLKFQADRSIAWAKVYATPDTISPELGIFLAPKPGRQLSWENQYSFYLLS